EVLAQPGRRVEPGRPTADGTAQRLQAPVGLRAALALPEVLLYVQAPDQVQFTVAVGVQQVLRLFTVHAESPGQPARKVAPGAARAPAPGGTSPFRSAR